MPSVHSTSNLCFENGDLTPVLNPQILGYKSPYSLQNSTINLKTEALKTTQYFHNIPKTNSLEIYFITRLQTLAQGLLKCFTSFRCVFFFLKIQQVSGNRKKLMVQKKSLCLVFLHKKIHKKIGASDRHTLTNVLDYQERFSSKYSFHQDSVSEEIRDYYL